MSRVNVSTRRKRIARPARAGMGLLYVTVCLVALFAMGSLALDFGRVQLAKTELRTMVDASVRHGVQWVHNGKSAALAKSNAVAAENKVAGQGLAFGNAHVKIGHWNAQTRAFTENLKPINAVRLEHSVVVPLALGPVIGMSSCTVRAHSIGVCAPMSVVGFSSVTFKNNTKIASYDSSVTTTPTWGTANDNGAIVSNGVIGENNNGSIKGDVVLGPSGSVDAGFTISGGTTKTSAALPVPADPAWTPTGNPGGISNTHYVYSGAAPLIGGTYWFESLTVNKPLSFSGPATIFVNGNITVTENLTAYNSIPSNLKIYQLGAGRTFSADKCSITAHIVAPRSAFTATNSFTLYGCCMFDTILVKNNAEFYYDETIGSVAGLSIVQ